MGRVPSSSCCTRGGMETSPRATLLVAPVSGSTVCRVAARVPPPQPTHTAGTVFRLANCLQPFSSGSEQRFRAPAFGLPDAVRPLPLSTTTPNPPPEPIYDPHSQQRSRTRPCYKADPLSRVLHRPQPRHFVEPEQALLVADEIVVQRRPLLWYLRQREAPVWRVFRVRSHYSHPPGLKGVLCRAPLRTPTPTTQRGGIRCPAVYRARVRGRCGAGGAAGYPPTRGPRARSSRRRRGPPGSSGRRPSAPR